MRSLTVNPRNMRMDRPAALNSASCPLCTYNKIPAAPESCNTPVIIRCELESPNLANSERMLAVVRHVAPNTKNEMAINQRKSSNNVMI